MPLDAILFGGRRATNVPLVVEATDWTHGVFIGSNISSERTAAAEGTVGELRRDPFAMLPFCGYNMADYFGHWLKVGQKLRFDRAPRIFQVNWFRKGTDGRFLWPGFGDNSRVIDWIIRRIEGSGPRGRQPDRPPAAHRGPQPRRHRRAARPTSTSCSRSTPSRGCARPTSPRSSTRPSAAASRRRCRPSSPRCATASSARADRPHEPARLATGRRNCGGFPARGRPARLHAT